MRAAVLIAALLAIAHTAEARDGAVCGSRHIRGEVLSPIRTKAPGCGISRPVRVTEIQGVTLKPAATMSCPTAKALRGWIRKTAKPQLSRVGGGLEALRVFDSYSCRPRNNRRGAPVSVHGKGQAIDIGAFLLKDGTTLSVLDDWRDRKYGGLLKKLHRGACGPFQTVLGPNYNAAHRNHFHFDLEKNGRFCV